jgi:transformation/transcription domain-associated protein
MAQLDILLDEDLLVGTGVTCRETLRPHAHSVLVDLIHNIRHQLNINQISRIIYVYSRNLLDSTLSLSIQTMSGKLLLSVIENIISGQHPPEEVRFLLIRTLDAFSQRLASLKQMAPSVANYKNRKPEDAGSGTLEGYLDLGNVQPIHTGTRLLDVTGDMLKGCFFLTQTCGFSLGQFWLESRLLFSTSRIQTCQSTTTRCRLRPPPLEKKWRYL